MEKLLHFKFSKSLKITFVILVILITFLAVSYAVASNKWFALGSDISKKQSKVIARVNNNIITESEFNAAKAMKESQIESTKQYMIKTGKSVDIPSYDDQSIINSLIDDTILYLESEAQGCKITKEEAKSFMQDTRQQMEDAMNGKMEISKDNIDQIKEQYQDLEQLAKGMGMDMNQYWEYSITFYQKTLSISKLKKKITSSLPIEDQKEKTKVSKKMEDFKKDLKNSGKYKIIIEK